MAHDGRYRQYENIPIPTYDEAISSRPSSSVGPHGGDEAERQGLLGQADGGYRPPAVESPRNSEDSDLQLPEVNGADDERRQVEELDYLDPSAPDTSRRSPRLYHRARLRGRGKWSQQLSSIGATLSSIRIPSLRSLYTPVRPAERTEEAQPDPRTWLTRTTQRLRIPEQYRMSAPTAARLCGLFTLMALVYILFAMDIFPGTRHRNGGAHFDPESVRAFVQDNIDGETIKSFLAHITSFDHVAGTEGDLYLAKWMQEYWEQAAGFDQMDLLSYHVYLDYPGDRSVTLMGPTSPGWTATLEEDMVYKDRQQTLTWHGHSKSGEAEGHLLFANGGSRDDFQYLRDQGIVTEGAIALVRYGGTEGDGALKIKAAEEAGCVGVLMYSDPFSVDPAGAWQPTDDMVQRGGVSAMSWVVGDPLTPGYASTKHAKRVSKEDNPGLPKIPSIPLAWRDAKVLISALEKHGVEVPPNWLGGPSHTDFIQWYSGNASSRAADAVPSIRLKNVNEENDRQQIWNLHGLIEGLETPQKKIIVGAHRDAWCFGSVDAGSATAVMMEIVRIFGELRNIGWRPLRTIEFVSWDAEAYNLVGSTEYVEEHADVLREHGVAYINVDAGVYGPRFRASGSPLWERALFHVLDRVDDPSGPGSIKNAWDRSGSVFGGLGAGSDYVAFQDIVGTSAIDFSFAAGGGGDDDDATHYPSHSCHETLEWMQAFGDPDLSRHKQLAQVWALLILEVADRPLIPFDVTAYARRLHDAIAVLGRDLAGLYARRAGRPSASEADLRAATNFTTRPLTDAVALLAKNAETFHRFEEIWTANVLAQGGLETAPFASQRLDWNERVARFETDLLDPEGLPGRTQFKHVVWSPARWGGAAAVGFAGVRDAVEGERDGEGWQEAGRMVERAAERVRIAAGRLLESS